MKAMVLRKCGMIETNPLALEEIPNPEPKADEVLVRVHCCAICRTDLHVIEGELPTQRQPVVPGHQIIGAITRIGSNVKLLKVGQRVGIAWLRSTCGECKYCRSERENLCLTPKFTGYHENGGFAEYAVVREDFAYSIPDSLSDHDAAPLMCAGIIGYRALKRSGFRPGGSLAIFGFGSSAHIISQIVRHQRGRLLVVTRAGNHEKLAQEIGAEWAGSNVEDFPGRVESAILFAPSGDLVPQALSVLERGGTLAVAGIHMSDIPGLNYEKHLFYEKNLCSVTANTRQDGLELLKAATDMTVNPRTTCYRLEQANQALQDLKADRIAGTGILNLLL